MEKKKILLFIALFCPLLSWAQQISGVIVDAHTGVTILYPIASYKGKHVALSGDANVRDRMS